MNAVVKSLVNVFVVVALFFSSLVMAQSGAMQHPQIEVSQESGFIAQVNDKLFELQVQVEQLSLESLTAENEPVSEADASTKQAPVYDLGEPAGDYDLVAAY